MPSLICVPFRFYSFNIILHMLSLICASDFSLLTDRRKPRLNLVLGENGVKNFLSLTIVLKGTRIHILRKIWKWSVHVYIDLHIKQKYEFWEKLYKTQAKIPKLELSSEPTFGHFTLLRNIILWKRNIYSGRWALVCFLSLLIYFSSFFFLLSTNIWKYHWPVFTI